MLRCSLAGLPLLLLLLLLLHLRPSRTAPGPGVLSLYYKSTLPAAALLKYNAGPGWTSPCPGAACVPFAPSANASFPAAQGWQYVEVAGNAVQWVELDAGGAAYDHCAGGANCAASAPGLYAQEGGQVSALATFPPGCPAACVPPRGACVQPGDVCVCSAGYAGADCSGGGGGGGGGCPNGTNGLPCSGHGSCSSGACACAAGWASCGAPGSAGAACATPTASDPRNCGACGAVCAADPARGIASATCAAGACSVTCSPGWGECPGAPGACTQGAPAACGLPGCQTFSDNQCQGSATATPGEYAPRAWQAPAPGQPGYLPSYQQHYRLVGYARADSASAARARANVSVLARAADAGAALEYSFDGGASWAARSWAAVCSAPAADCDVLLPLATCAVAGQQGSVNASVRHAGGAALAADPVWLSWCVPPLAPPPPGRDDRGGQKGAIVELFGWPAGDVAAECADLGAAGWLGAKLWPVAESLASDEPFQGALNPWFFFYQPVSYRLEGRGGSSAALRAAVRACRANGVRLYADAVFNHFVGAGNDALPSHRAGTGGGGCTTWGPKSSSASFWYPANSSQGPSYAATQDYRECAPRLLCRVAGVASPPPQRHTTHSLPPRLLAPPNVRAGAEFQPNARTGLPPSQEFPAAPFSTLDFHCERPLNSWTDPLDLNAGWLEGLVDLNTGLPSVQRRIADQIVNLVSFGFSGLRIDAAKHMAPADHVAILALARASLGGRLPPDFMVWQEVLTGGEADMLVANAASGYNYGAWMEGALLAAGFSEEEMLAIRLWADYFPKQPGADNGNVDMRRKAVQIDDADQQTSGSTSRDMGGAGCVLTVNCPDAATHRGFVQGLFASPPGATDNDSQLPIRLVLSSFWFDLSQGAYGIPDGLSDCARCRVNCDKCVASMPYSPARQAGAPGYTPRALGAYTRVHRDLAIVNAMRAWVHLPPLNASSALA